MNDQTCFKGAYGLSTLAYSGGADEPLPLDRLFQERLDLVFLGSARVR